MHLRVKGGGRGEEGTSPGYRRVPGPVWQYNEINLLGLGSGWETMY